jgi:hypothetical protein
MLPLFTPLCLFPKTNLVDLLNLFQTGKKGHLTLVGARLMVAEDLLNAGHVVPEAAGFMGYHYVRGLDENYFLVSICAMMMMISMHCLFLIIYFSFTSVSLLWKMCWNNSCRKNFTMNPLKWNWKPYGYQLGLPKSGRSRVCPATQAGTRAQEVHEHRAKGIVNSLIVY